MDARVRRGLTAVAAVLSLGAGYRTPNFVVDAPTPEIARQVGQSAEKYRKELALRWLGEEMPRWSKPCPIRVNVGNVGAGGTTTFACSHGEVYHWNMVIQGTLERILDSVLPHEVNHTVLASHFRRPLVRWADEGAATFVEDALEHERQRRVLLRLLTQRRLIPLRQLLDMKEYPRDVAALYSQGYALTHYLVQQGGHAKFLSFLDAGREHGWDAALQAHYRSNGVDQLEREWLAWIRNGARDLVTPDADRALAATSRPQRPQPNIIYRGQTPDEDDEFAATGTGPSRGWGTHEQSPGALTDATDPQGSLSPNGVQAPHASPPGDGLAAHGNHGWTARGPKRSGTAPRQAAPPPNRIASIASGPETPVDGWAVDADESNWFNPRSDRPAPSTADAAFSDPQAPARSDEPRSAMPLSSPWSGPSQSDPARSIIGDASASGLEYMPRSEPIRRAPTVRRAAATPSMQPRRAPVGRPLRRRVIRAPVLSWPGSGST